MFPNVLQQEIVNFLNICQDEYVIKHKSFIKATNKIWLKNSKYTVTNKIFNVWKCKISRVNGLIHSINDQPAIVFEDGEKHWYYNNVLHREIGPAQITPSGMCF